MFFFKKNISTNLNALILGFASGIMFAACFCELIYPAISLADGSFKVLPVLGGLVIGNLFMLFIDKAFKQTGPQSNFMLAITVHNIPEGLIVGLSFGGAIAAGGNSILSSLFLAAGIALQNVPEGMAVSFTLKNRLGNKKSFLYGVLSGAVEPVFALFGLFLSAKLSALMPWFLAFSAGVMMYVSTEEMIPESKTNSHLGTIGFAVGFILLLAFELILR